MRFYETFNRVRGSYIQSMVLTDPDVIDVLADASDKDWEPGPPPLFGWTSEIDALTNIADQMIASRAQGEGVKFYPRPVFPAEKERKRRKADKQSKGLEAAMQRGFEAANWNLL
ncbi:hypothetical protein [Mycobacteroides abscessus]|uniref:hypothetical protein n=1 Tax=Mycobacteroides abscessus TaxID=36809 RepID=UPI0018964F95|nr:hypothetical protein [Mycobacteroides abscessus]